MLLNPEVTMDVKFGILRNVFGNLLSNDAAANSNKQVLYKLY